MHGYDQQIANESLVSDLHVYLAYLYVLTYIAKVFAEKNNVLMPKNLSLLWVEPWGASPIPVAT